MTHLSIITINYNNLPGLKKTVESVLNQSFTDFEYIVIDGGSTDGSKEFIVENANKFSYWISEKDAGVYVAMNKGIAKSNGEYLMFLNSGDYLVNESILEKSIKRAASVPADIYYGNIIVELEKGKPQSKQHPENITLDILESQTINHQASFIKRNLFAELGLYDLKYTLAADHAFYLKSFLNGKKFEHINLDMVFYQLDGLSFLNHKEYWLQIESIKQELIPEFLIQLRMENKKYTMLHRHRIIRWATIANKNYHCLRQFFK